MSMKLAVHSAGPERVVDTVREPSSERSWTLWTVQVTCAPDGFLNVNESVRLRSAAPAVPVLSPTPGAGGARAPPTAALPPPRLIPYEPYACGRRGSRVGQQ